MSDPLDVLGIGFGPSNLALAAALREHPCAPSSAFLERKPGFSWHTGMLIDGTTMQVSFLKDLVTMRNPNSRYSFLSYLHASGRLADFINHKTLFPSRVEFHDYLCWMAGFFADQVRYGAEVVDVTPVVEAGEVTHLDVTAQAGEQTLVRRARNLVVGTGLESHFPPEVPRDARIWHSSELMYRLAELADEPRRVVVVGAGQSAAEVTAHLHERFTGADVYAVFARYGYSVSDDSPFANRIFDPEAVDDFHTASPYVRQMLLDYHGNTNYSVVDADLIDELYRRSYEESVRGRARLHFLRASRVAGVTPTEAYLAVEVESLVDRDRTILEADLVVYGTGYRPTDMRAVLGDLADLCKFDEQGRIQTGREYRVRTEGSVQCGIYLQGATEHSHGISSSLLSTTAVRAGEIAAAIGDDRNGPDG